MKIYKQKSKGPVVAQIQKIVGAYPDGIWGPLTTECVKQWQADHGLAADGVVGAATLAKMGIGTGAAPAAPVKAATEVCLGTTLKRSKRRIDDIVIHCTATPEGRAVSVDQLRQDHRAQGWSDIGYHYVIYRDGTVHQGRDVDVSGAHVKGYNAHSIGVVYVGGLENKPGVPYEKLKPKDTRTEAQKASLLSLLMDLRRLYPKAKIQGHRDFSPDLNHNGMIEPKEWIKACPSFDAKTEYKIL
jgi:N-acetyl-anhydromuramyl-L-alanine amidase AmpD